MTSVRAFWYVSKRPMFHLQVIFQSLGPCWGWWSSERRRGPCCPSERTPPSRLPTCRWLPSVLPGSILAEPRCVEATSCCSLRSAVCTSGWASSKHPDRTCASCTPRCRACQRSGTPTQREEAHPATSAQAQCLPWAGCLSLVWLCLPWTWPSPAHPVLFQGTEMQTSSQTCKTSSSTLSWRHRVTLSVSRAFQPLWCQPRWTSSTLTPMPSLRHRCLHVVLWLGLANCVPTSLLRVSGHPQHSRLHCLQDLSKHLLWWSSWTIPRWTPTWRWSPHQRNWRELKQLCTTGGFRLSSPTTEPRAPLPCSGILSGILGSFSPRRLIQPKRAAVCETW